MMIFIFEVTKFFILFQKSEIFFFPFLGMFILLSKFIIFCFKFNVFGMFLFKMVILRFEFLKMMFGTTEFLFPNLIHVLILKFMFFKFFESDFVLVTFSLKNKSKFFSLLYDA